MHGNGSQNDFGGNARRIGPGNSKGIGKVGLWRRLISYFLCVAFIYLIGLHDLVTLRLFPEVVNVCKIGVYPHCQFQSAYNIYYYGIRWVVRELAYFNGLITAVAGTAVAALTYTLWRTNEKLWETSDGQLQAFKKSSAESSETAKFQRKRLVSQFNLIRKQSHLLEAQLRLQITLSRPIIHPIYETSIQKDPLTGLVIGTFDVQLKNIGHSQARAMTSWWIGHSFGDVPDEQISFHEPREDSPELHEERNLFPNRSWNGGKILITPNELMGILKGTHPYYIWGRCEFNDVFDGTIRYWMTHCAELVCPAAFKDSPEALIKTVIASENRVAFSLQVRANAYHNDNGEYSRNSPLKPIT